MRLLWMKSDYVIPPDTGGKIRSYNLLRQLNKLCDVTYLSFRSDEPEGDTSEMQQCAKQVITLHRPEERKDGLQFYVRVLKSMLSPLPYTAQKYRSAAIIEHQRRFVNDAPHDDQSVVLCDFLEMVENVDWSLPCPKVLFQHNVESMIWDRYYQTESHPLKKAFFNFERKRMRRYEAASCNHFDLVFTVSQEDKVVLQDSLGVTSRIEVLDTGVDGEYFTPQAPTLTVPQRLVFLGSLDWMPNIDGLQWFVDNVYSLIRGRTPSVTLDIVGRRPVGKIAKLSRDDPTIRVIADVPDVRPFVAAADLFVVPLRVGGGSRIKIFEAMAMQKPVVSTTIGAEGLPLIAGQHIAIGDTPGEFAQRVVELLDSPLKRQAIANCGWQLVTENYHWKSVAIKLRDSCAQLRKS